MRIVAFMILVAALASGMVKWTEHRDKYLMEVQDCVVKTAQYNHYAGNPYSLEAWQTFQSECP